MNAYLSRPRLKAQAWQFYAIRLLVPFIAAAALAACQTPAIKDRIVTVSVPIATHPIKPGDVPTVPAPLGPRPKSLSAAADTLLSDHCSWVAFGLRAMPLLRVSAGLPPLDLPRYPECEH